MAVVSDRDLKRLEKRKKARKRKPNEKFSAYIYSETNEIFSPIDMKTSEENLPTYTSEHGNNDSIPNKSSNKVEKHLDILFKICSLIAFSCSIIFISVYAIVKISPTSHEHSTDQISAMKTPHKENVVINDALNKQSTDQISAMETPHKENVVTNDALNEHSPDFPDQATAKLVQSQVKVPKEENGNRYFRFPPGVLSLETVPI